MKLHHYLLLIGEQASVSAPSVLYLLGLARVLTAADFTLVSFGYSIYLVLGALYDAIVIEPMLLSLSDTPSRSDRDPIIIWRISVYSALTGLCVWIVLWQVSGRLEIRAIALAAGLLPSIIVLTFLRKLLNARGRMLRSATAGFVYCVGFMTSGGALYFSNLLSAALAPIPFLLGASLFALIAFWRSPFAARQPAEQSPGWLRDHLRLASTTTLYAVCANLTLNIYPFLFAALSEPLAISEFRLVSLVFTPFFQIWAAVYSFTLPRLRVQKISEIQATMRLMLILIVLAPLAAALISAIWGEKIAFLLFGSRYADLGPLLPVALLGATASIALNTAGMWFRSHRQMAPIRATGLLQLAVTACLGWPMVSTYGTLGAFITYGLANLAALLLTGYLTLWRKTGGPSVQTNEPPSV